MLRTERNSEGLAKEWEEIMLSFYFYRIAFSHIRRVPLPPGIMTSTEEVSFTISVMAISIHVCVCLCKILIGRLG